MRVIDVIGPGKHHYVSEHRSIMADAASEPSMLKMTAIQQRRKPAPAIPNPAGWLRSAVQMPKQAFKRNGVAVAAESAHHAEAHGSEHRSVPKVLASVHIRQVGLNDR